MFDVNPNLTTITYCEGTTGWPQDFSNGSTTITATSIVCSPPDAPTIDSITPGAGQLTVAFTPGIDNGSPAYSYEASCLRVVGSGRIRVDVVGPTSPITVPSMYNGDTYECFVTATNIIGTSPASATSEPFVVGAPATSCLRPPPRRRLAQRLSQLAHCGYWASWQDCCRWWASVSCVKPEAFSSPPSAGFLLAGD